MKKTQKIAQNYIETGRAKAKHGALKLFVLGILAGVFVSAAGMGATTAAEVAHNATAAKLINAAIFPAGLAMVVIAGSELFTGNCLMIIPVLEKRISLYEMLRNWFFVYLGNFAGSLLFVFLCTMGHVYVTADVSETLIEIATVKANISFGDAFVKGVLCNILVCIAIWMTFTCTTSPAKIASLFLPIMVFVICGFEHSIANMSYISSGLFIKEAYNIPAPELSWVKFIFGNLLPVTLGNIVGGCSVGIAYWIGYLWDDKYSMMEDVEENEQ